MMQIDFQKEVITVSEMRANQSATLLVEGDVIVPDIKPDIKEILLTEASAVITNQNYAEGKLHVTGTASVKILYLPDAEHVQPKSIDAKFDFKDTLEFSGDENLEISCRAVTEHIEFSLINSRKLNVKVVVSVSARGYHRDEMTLLSGTAEDSPLKIRTKQISAYQVVADTTRELAIADTIEIPSAKPDADELIKLDVKAFKGDCKIMSGKILLKGALMIHTLYGSSDPDAAIECMEHELPFSEVIDIEGLSEDCLCNVAYEVKDVFHTLKDDTNGDPRVISLDVVLRADIIASKTREIDVIDDCYTTFGVADIKREQLRLDELLCEGVSHVSMKEILSIPETMPAAGAVYNLSCKPKVGEIQIIDEKLLIKGKLIVFVLYGSTNGEAPLYSLVNEFDFEHSIPADGADETAYCECGVTDQNVSFTLNAASEIELRCVLEFYTRAIKPTVLQVISGATITEEDIDILPERGLIIYFVQKGDTLWDIAKHYRTDYEKIMQLNQMDNSLILPGQKLLIPRN